jgi:uncharacterized protein YrzB (UPF0473 family)
MFKVMNAVDFVKKTAHIQFKNTDYKALKEEVVTPIYREEFIKNKLLVFPIEQISEKNNGITKIDIKYKIVDIESGESEIISSSGEGADTQDKGAGKAMTYAYKYMLLRTFMTPTGEDPDTTSSAELDDKAAKASKQNKVIDPDIQLKRDLVEQYKGDKTAAKKEYERILALRNKPQQETLDGDATKYLEEKFDMKEAV